MAEWEIPVDVPSRKPDPLAAALTDLAAAVRELAAALKSTPGTKTVATQVRYTADHRDPNASSGFGFAPVKAIDLKDPVNLEEN